MNNKIGLKLYKHITQISILSRQDIVEILEYYPDVAYNGLAFRALSFSKLMLESDISNDICFAKNEESIKRMSYLFDHQYVQVYKAQVIGLDLEKCMNLNLFGDFTGGNDLNHTIISEKEILVCSVFSIEMIYNGDLNFYLNE